MVLKRPFHCPTRVIQDRAAHWSEEAGERVSRLSDVTGARAAEAADTLRDSTKDFSRSFQKQASHGIDVAESALSAARTIVAAVLVKTVNDWIRQIR